MKVRPSTKEQGNEIVFQVRFDSVGVCVLVFLPVVPLTYVCFLCVSAFVWTPSLTALSSGNYLYDSLLNALFIYLFHVSSSRNKYIGFDYL